MFVLMNRYLLFPLLLTIQNARTQSLTVTIDGSGQEIKDTIVLLHHTLPVRPGRITTSTFPISAPIELSLGETAFLVGANDSIHISYDPQQQKYKLDGGRYPDNYRILSDLLLTTYSHDRYRNPADNYEEYVRVVDSISGHSLTMIKAAQEKGTLSPDAAVYLMDFVKYEHLAVLLDLRSKTLGELLPATHSSLYPTVTTADFRQDRYSRMLSYTLSAVSYLQARFRSINRDSSLTKEIDFAIDSLSGDTRVRVLYFMIVESGYKPANNKAAFTVLYNRIRLLHFATDYARGIEEQYKKVMREQQPLGTSLLNQPLLRTPAGRSISLRSILDTCKNEDIFIKFVEFGMDIVDGGDIGIMPVVANPRIITIDLYTSFQDWQRHTKGRLLTNEFFLADGLKNPLAASLFITHLPTWIALNRSGRIDDIDISFEDRFRYNLAGH